MYCQFGCLESRRRHQCSPGLRVTGLRVGDFRIASARSKRASLAGTGGLASPVGFNAVRSR